MMRPSIDPTEAMTQASMTTHDYFRRAIRIIDEVFGEGYAKAHPNLLASMIRSQHLEFANTSDRDGIGSITDELENIAEQFGRIADAIEKKEVTL